MISDAKKGFLDIVTYFSSRKIFFLLTLRIFFLLQDRNSRAKKNKLLRCEKKKIFHYYFLGIRKHFYVKETFPSASSFQE